MAPKALFKILKADLGHVDSGMYRKVALSVESFVALVALERLFPTVCHHVALQVTRSSASEVALVTLVQLFSGMLPHYVNFQRTSCDAGILAPCASVRLFPRVGPFVPLQVV